MTCCQDDRTVETFACIGFHAGNLFAMDDQGIHARFKMNFATTADNLLPNILDHARQFICSDMRMGIREDRCAGTKLAKDIQDLVDLTALLATGVELAIRICSGTSFTKTIIRFAVHFMLAADQGDIFLPFAHILPAFDYDRA